MRMQDPGGEKYFTFHRILLGKRGPAGKDAALAAAAEAGLDMDRITRDLVSEEVATSLAESAALARALGVNGTPVT